MAALSTRIGAPEAGLAGGGHDHAEAQDRRFSPANALAPHHRSNPAGRHAFPDRFGLARRGSRWRYAVSIDRVGADQLSESRGADPPNLFDRRFGGPRRLELAVDEIHKRLGEGSVQFGRNLDEIPKASRAKAADL